MTLQEAKELIIKRINNPKFVILDENTIVKDWGWIFFYQSSKFLKSENISDALAGNALFIVNKNTGEIIETGTAFPIDHYIQEYENNLSLTE